MSLIKGKVISVIKRSETSILVNAKYVGGHEMFAPLGFEYEFKENLDKVKEGFIWVFFNYPNSKIVGYPDGHDKIMAKFSDNLEKLFNK